MKKKKLFTKLAAGAMAFALCLSNMGTSLAAPSGYQDYTGHTVSPAQYTYDEATNPLYAATKYHVFAEEKASITAHCNGNIATPYLTQGANSGSNKLYDSQEPEYTYIREFDKNSIARFGPKTNVVFGKETGVYIMNNTDAEIYIEMVDGDSSVIQKMDKPSNGKVLTEDADTRFIDFDSEFKKLSKLSYNMASDTSQPTATFNENVVDMTGVTGTAFINLKTTDLMNRAFVVDNVDFTKQALVINVDLGTATSYTLPFTQVLFKDSDGDSFGTGEDKDELTGLGNVLWNFYGRDAHGNIVTYTGEIMTCSEFKGTILAPDAVIRTASSNQDGNFIGRQVHLGGGETHRWDFGGKLPTYPDYGSIKVTVEENDGTPIEEVKVIIVDPTTGDVVGELITDANGETDTVDGLVQGKEYEVTLNDIPYGYVVPADKTENQIITDADPDVVEFVLEKDETAYPAAKGYYEITVKDADTGELIKGAVIEITDTTAEAKLVETGLTTDEHGVVDSSKISLSENKTENMYTLTVENVPDGYDLTSVESQTVELTDANPDKVVFLVKKEEVVVPKGSLQINVVVNDNGTERPIEGAIVKITDKDAHIIKEVTVVTDVNGKTEIVGGLVQQDTYNTSIISIPKGFKLDTTVTGNTADRTVAISNANPDVIKYVLVQETGSLVAKVTDTEGNVVPEVTVAIYDNNNELVGNYDTNNLGYADELYNLKAGDKYTANVVGVPEGYKISDNSSYTTGTATIQNDTLAEIVLKVEKISTAGIKAVVETEDGTAVPGVEVVVKDSDGDKVTSLVTGGETDTVDELELGDYETTIVVPDGYKLVSNSNTISVKLDTDGETETVTYVIAKKTGDIKVTVTDVAGDPVEGVTVKITDDAGNPAGTDTGVYKTNSKGLAAEITGLPVGNTYKATVTAAPEGYVVSTTTEYTTGSNTIVADDCVEIILKVEEKEVVADPVGDLYVVITDAVTDELIEGAKVVVKDADGNVKATVTTDETGAFTVKDLAPGVYTVVTESVPEGYTAPTDKTAEVKANDTAKVPLEVEKVPGSLSVVITDLKTKEVIPGATVVITNGKINYEETFTTDANGEISVDKLYPGDYKVTTTKVPEGYNIPNAQTGTVESEKNTNVPLTVEKEPGKLIVTIVDANDGDPIPGATVIVKNDKIGYNEEVKTDSEGKLEIDKLYPGEYDIITKDVPGDYEEEDWPEDTTATVVSGGTTQKDLEVPADNTTTPAVGNLQVTIKDKNTKEPIKDATVVITIKDDKNDPAFEKVVTTDENGQVSVKDLEPNTYVITTTKVPTGYTAPDADEGTVIAGQTAIVNLVVFKPGAIDVTIIDKNTLEPIPDTTVQIIDKTTGEVVKEVITDEDGNVVADGLEPGDYTVHVPDVPDYDEPEDKDVTVEPGVTTPAKLEVEKNETTPIVQPGKLDVTIIDRLTQDPIPDAKVEIIDKTTGEVVKEVTTDENGNVVVDNLEPGDYIIHVVDTPDYAEPKDETVTVESGKTTDRTLIVEKVGQMQITITDKNDPTKPIPNATVVVKDKDNNIVATLTTNEKGQTDVVKDLIVGDTYTIETTKVPDGYTPPTPTTQKITGTELIIVPLEVGRDSGITSSVGSLYVIITDKNTGAPIPEATVEVSNSKGEIVKTVVTDNTGSFTVDNLKPDNYTVKTTKVPAGYTAPDAQSAAVKSNARTDVHLYVAKSATKDPTPSTGTNIDTVVQTGDESNVQVVSILAVLSCLGIVVVSIKRRRELI